MSSLQLWLAVVGGLLLAGIVAHGAWQSRRSGVKQATERSAAGPSPFTSQREPVFLDPEETATAVPGAGRLDRDVDGVAPPAAKAFHDARGTRTALWRTPIRIDALIDAIVLMRLDQPVTGELALSHFPVTRRAGSKSFLIEGLDAETGDWEPITAEHTYSELQAGVQLANRLGGINEIEYSEFVQKVQTFSDGVGAMPDFPDMLEVVARARELDNFACARDAQLAMRLRARSTAWSVAHVQEQAAQQGFTPGGVPGRLILGSEEEGSPPVLTLQFDAQAAFAEDPNQAVVTELVLTFDVPQTAAEGRPYDHWCRIGLALAVALDATLHDDSGQPLNPDSLPAVGDELQKLYVALAERDLAAGSAAARRLFS